MFVNAHTHFFIENNINIMSFETIMLFFKNYIQRPMIGDVPVLNADVIKGVLGYLVWRDSGEDESVSVGIVLFHWLDGNHSVCICSGNVTVTKTAFHLLVYDLTYLKYMSYDSFIEFVIGFLWMRWILRLQVMSVVPLIVSLQVEAKIHVSERRDYW